MIASIKEIQRADQSSIGNTIRTAVGFTLGIAVDVAVTLALGHLIPGGRGLKKYLAKAGVFVLSMMAGEKAEEYVYTVFDDTKELFEDAQRLLEAGEPEIEVVKVE
jgi:hypothetical protein